MVGDGTDRRAVLERIEEYKLGHRIRWVGIQPTNEVFKYLKASDVFVALYDVSAVSNTVLEALAIGTPVVSSDRGDGIATLVVDGRTGYRVRVTQMMPVKAFTASKGPPP